jgi:acyl CoA:acetate/3-ketoacid CoA transferase beta subunit
MVVTELCVFQVDEGGLVLTEIAADVTLDQVRAATEASFRVAEPLRTIA